MWKVNWLKINKQTNLKRNQRRREKERIKERGKKMGKLEKISWFRINSPQIIAIVSHLPPTKWGPPTISQFSLAPSPKSTKLGCSPPQLGGGSANHGTCTLGTLSKLSYSISEHNFFSEFYFGLQWYHTRRYFQWRSKKFVKRSNRWTFIT